MTEVQPGDVLVIRDPRNFWAKLIRFGAALDDHPNLRNHVIVASHTDDAGTFWGVEARPGGVGWCDLKPWLANPWTVTNAEQTKQHWQRDAIVQIVNAMVPRKTQYDWPAIVEDAFDAVGVADMYRLKDYGDLTPDHVVCSSLASWAYKKCSLECPLADEPPYVRGVEPWHWDQWILLKGWARP